MRFFLSGAVLAVLVLVSSAFGMDTNLQILPPPMVTPEFRAGGVDTKVGLLYAGLRGGGIRAAGYGANVVQRRAIDDRFAWDWQAAFFTLDGSGRGGSLSYRTVPLGANLEYQPLRTDSSSAILFVGATYSRSTAEFKEAVTTPVLPALPSDVTAEMTTRGWQAGGQYSRRIMACKLIPFVMFQSLSGRVDLSSAGQALGSTDIPSYNVATFGIDLLYPRRNLSLSSALQLARKSDNDSSAIRTTTLGLSWLF